MEVSSLVGSAKNERPTTPFFEFDLDLSWEAVCLQPLLPKGEGIPSFLLFTNDTSATCYSHRRRKGSKDMCRMAKNTSNKNTTQKLVA